MDNYLNFEYVISILPKKILFLTLKIFDLIFFLDFPVAEIVTQRAIHPRLHRKSGCIIARKTILMK